MKNDKLPTEIHSPIIKHESLPKKKKSDDHTFSFEEAQEYSKGKIKHDQEV